MPREKSESHRASPEDQSDGEENDTARHTVDERTAKVLDDADDFLKEVDEVLYGNILNEHARNRYAQEVTRSFVRKDGQ
jgi:Pup-like protein